MPKSKEDTANVSCYFTVSGVERKFFSYDKEE